MSNFSFSNNITCKDHLCLRITEAAEEPGEKLPSLLKQICTTIYSVCEDNEQTEADYIKLFILLGWFLQLPGRFRGFVFPIIKDELLILHISCTPFAFTIKLAELEAESS